MRLIWDADMLVFRACTATVQEVEWQDGVYSMYVDANELHDYIDTTIKDTTEKILNHYKHNGEFSLRFAFSDYAHNFRKVLNPEYKANRNKQGLPKPVGFMMGKKYIEENYVAIERANIEADDVIGIYATMYDDVVIISGDKDMKCVPAKFYNFLSDEYSEATLEDADRQVLYQTLIGDTADNYKGCPGVGPVSAKKILDADCSWQAVVRQYEKKGLTEEDALMNARMAFILRAGYYKDGKAKLWLPE